MLERTGNGGEGQGSFNYVPNGFAITKMHQGMTLNACCIMDVCRTRRNKGEHHSTLL